MSIKNSNSAAAEIVGQAFEKGGEGRLALAQSMVEPILF